MLVLGHFGIILGTDWMKKHDLFLVDFKKLQVTIMKKGKILLIQYAITNGKGNCNCESLINACSLIPGICLICQLNYWWLHLISYFI